jgi:hypothetical protein
MIALRLFELHRERCSSVPLAHGEHVRMVAEVVITDAEETEYETGRLGVVIGIPERDIAAVVRHREQHVRGHREIAAPRLLLDGDRRRAGDDVGRHLDPEVHALTVSPCGEVSGVGIPSRPWQHRAPNS